MERQSSWQQVRTRGSATRAGAVMGAVAIAALGMALAARSGSSRITVVPAGEVPIQGPVEGPVQSASTLIPQGSSQPVAAPAEVTAPNAIAQATPSETTAPTPPAPLVAPAQTQAEVATVAPAVEFSFLPVRRTGLGPPVPMDLPTPPPVNAPQEPAPVQPAPLATPPAVTPAVPPATTPATTPAQPTSPASAIIDLNSATKAQLELLPGIGPALAQRILDHRVKLGRFASVEDLEAVRGIGPKVMAKLRPLVRVSTSEQPASPAPAPKPR
jgi:competence ComEA-like helix-hairpin-helix protein